MLFGQELSSTDHVFLQPTIDKADRTKQKEFLLLFYLVPPDCLLKFCGLSSFVVFFFIFPSKKPWEAHSVPLNQGLELPHEENEQSTVLLE